MLFEMLREEKLQHLKSVTELSKAGKLKWECVEYSPISLTEEDLVDEKPAFLSHAFECKTHIDGLPHTLFINESITIPDGKGDIALAFTREVPDDYLRIDDALEGYFDEYEVCAPEDLLDRFSDTFPVMLSNLVFAQAVEAECLEEEFSLARFFYGSEIPKCLGKHPMVKLGKKLFKEHRAADFHRCILDTKFRNELLRNA